MMNLGLFGRFGPGILIYLSFWNRCKCCHFRRGLRFHQRSCGGQKHCEQEAHSRQRMSCKLSDQIAIPFRSSVWIQKGRSSEQACLWILRYRSPELQMLGSFWQQQRSLHLILQQNNFDWSDSWCYCPGNHTTHKNPSQIHPYWPFPQRLLPLFSASKPMLHQQARQSRPRPTKLPNFDYL